MTPRESNTIVSHTKDSTLANQVVLGFDTEVNINLGTCSRGDYVFGCISRVHFAAGKVSGILSFLEKQEFTCSDTYVLPPASASFTLWVPVPPKENTPVIYSFVGKQTVYASKDMPTAPLTVQIDVPVNQKLGTKRLEPIKASVGISVQLIVTGMEKSCITGELLEYILTDKLERPNIKPKVTPKRPRALIIQEGEDGQAASPSKKHRK